MGLGRFGGGLAAAESLLAEGRQVLVTDLAEKRPASRRHQLRETFGTQVRFSTWGPRQEDFTQAKLVIANPVPQPWHNPYLQTAWASGAPSPPKSHARWISSVILDHRHHRQRGQHHHRHDPRGVGGGGHPATRGGNLGESLVGTPKDHTLVVELSSAMAWWLYERRRPPANL